MKIIFAGSADFSLPTLSKLFTGQHELLAILTQPDRPSGRGQKLTPTPVKQLALKHQVPILSPVSLKTNQAMLPLEKLTPDLIVVIAYGLLIPPQVLTIPKYGCINLHPSLLPAWRGATPIQHSLLAGETQTGITVIRLDEGMDSGPIIQQQTVNILPNETSGELHHRLANLGADLIMATLAKFSDHTVTFTPQNSNQATYTKKITKQDALINWHDNAAHINNQVRAYNPWPVAHTHFNNQGLRLWQAQEISQSVKLPPGTLCGLTKQHLDIATTHNVLRLHEVQLAGKRRQPIQDFINSHRDQLIVGQNYFS